MPFDASEGRLPTAAEIAASVSVPVRLKVARRAYRELAYALDSAMRRTRELNDLLLTATASQKPAINHEIAELAITRRDLTAQLSTARRAVTEETPVFAERVSRALEPRRRQALDEITTTVSMLEAQLGALTTIDDGVSVESGGAAEMPWGLPAALNWLRLRLARASR